MNSRKVKKYKNTEFNKYWIESSYMFYDVPPRDIGEASWNAALNIVLKVIQGQDKKVVGLRKNLMDKILSIKENEVV